MRRQLKLAVSLLLRAWDILHDAFFRLIGKPLPPRCMVLYYHAIPARHRALFARQLDTILRIARPVSTNPNGGLTPGTRYVSVTFDDGFVSVLHNAAPELKARQIPWTIFVPSGRLGQKPDWLKRAHLAAREDRVMTREELRQLSTDPLVTIGSHTVGHVNLLEVDPQRASSELAESKEHLENLLARPVLQFSYPFGGRSPAIDDQARSAGYTQLFCSEPTYAVFPSPSPSRPPSSALGRPASVLRPLSSERVLLSSDLCPLNSLPIGRASVDPDMSPLEFRLKILGAYRWLGRRDHKTTDH